MVGNSVLLWTKKKKKSCVTHGQLYSSGGGGVQQRGRRLAGSRKQTADCLYFHAFRSNTGDVKTCVTVEAVIVRR